MRVRLPLAALVAALALPAAEARAEEPLPVPPSYSPADHGGLPYPAYLRMSRGTARRSTGMMIGGIIITGLGTTLQASGLGVFARGRCSDRVFDPTTASMECQHARGPEVSGLALMLAGTIALATGIPLWVVGQSHVPWAQADGRAPPPPPRWARILPTIAPTGRGAEMVFRF